LDYTHAGLARVLVTGGGRPPMLLLLGTGETAADFWRLDTDAGPVLVRGTALVRSAEASGRRLALRADTAEPGPVEVFAPARRLAVNGRQVRTQRTPSGSLVGSLPGPRDVALPELDGWQARTEAPEAEPGFDDAGWVAADHTTSPSPMEPLTQPVL
jgi:hypothetical protein